MIKWVLDYSKQDKLTFYSCTNDEEHASHSVSNCTSTRGYGVALHSNKEHMEPADSP